MNPEKALPMIIVDTVNLWDDGVESQAAINWN